MNRLRGCPLPGLRPRLFPALANIITLVVLAYPHTTPATEPLLLYNNIDLIAKAGGEGQSVIRSHYIYLRNDEGNLEIHDIQNPAVPIKLSETITGQESYMGDIAIVGNRAYIVGGKDERQEDDELDTYIYYRTAMDIIDISNPHAPIRIGSLNDDAFYNTGCPRYLYSRYAATGIATDGTMAYLVSDDMIVKINVSNPQALRVEAFIEIWNSGCAPALSGDYLYTTVDELIHIFDVSKSGSLLHKITLGSFVSPIKVVTSGKYAYLTHHYLIDQHWFNSRHAFSILDIHQPLEPSCITSVTLPMAPIDFAYCGGLVYLSQPSDPLLQVFDVSDPTHPAILATINRPGDQPEYGINVSADSSNGLVYLSGDLIPGHVIRYAPAGAVKVSNISRAGYRADYLRPRNLPYSDRSFEFGGPLPVAGLKEQTYILTRNDDKYSTSSSFLSFNIDRPATVYVAYDERAAAPPKWLSGWASTSLHLSITDTLGPNRRLYARHFPAGKVTLGGNRDAGAPFAALSMYSVILAPDKGASTQNWAGYE